MNLRLFFDGNVNALTAQQVKDIEDFITPIQYVTIATLNSETGVRLSVLSSLPGQKVNELYFITDLISQKAKNILANPGAEISYSTEMQGLVIFKGKVDILTDTETKKAKFMPWVNEFFPKGVEDENYCVLKLNVESIRAQLF